MTETTAKNLEQAIDAYLLWMKEEGYHPESYRTHKATLHLFLDFIRDREFEWNDVFTLDTVTFFQKHYGLAHARGVKGLSRKALQEGDP